MVFIQLQETLMGPFGLNFRLSMKNIRGFVFKPSIFVSMKMQLRIILLLITFSSCQLVGRKMFGIKKRINIEKQDVLDISKSYFVQDYLCGYIDSTGGMDLLNEKDLVKKSYIHQPLNMMVFDSLGNWVGSVANCDAEATFNNLSWESLLIEFPIRNSFVDTALQLSHFKNAIKVIESGENIKIENKYTVVVFWSTFMGRQNRNFLEDVSVYLNKNNANVWSINADLFFGGVNEF
jgi:hypothetical protein